MIGLKKKDSRPTIGVIKNNIVGHRGILLSQGLKYLAKEKDVNLIIYSGGLINKDVEATRIYDFVDKNNFDGLIIWTGDINWFCSQEKTINFVKRYSFLPVVSLEIKIDGITSIMWDDYNGMRDAIIHLIEVHNYKRIAFIHGPSEHAGVTLRYKAYLDTLMEYGIAIDHTIIIDQLQLYNYEESVRLLEYFLVDGVEAIVSINDYNIRVLNRIIKDKSLPAIPMVGFDDDIESSASNPTLTSVHPPLYEIGKRAIEVILAKMKGEHTSETESLPCNMVLRQSCGCQCISVMKENLYKEKVELYLSKLDIKNINAEEFVSIIKNTIKNTITIPDDIDADWADILLRAFFDEVYKSNDENFIDYLEKYVAHSSGRKHIDIIQDFIIIMHFFLDAFHQKNNFDWYKAKKLLRQAAVLIGDMMMRVEISKRIQKDLRHYDVISFTRDVTKAFYIGELVEKLIQELKMFGVASCYLSIYENDGESTDKARLILAYNEKERIEINPEFAVFPSVQLIPDGILSYDKRFEFVLNPLHFLNRQIGFVLFEDTLDDPSEYQLLSRIISNALNSVKMIEDLEGKSLEVIKTNKELESAYLSLTENQQKLLISEKMASLGRLTAGIAHEMNTPLASLRTSLKELDELIDEYIISIGNPQVMPEDHRLIAADMSKYLKLADQAVQKSAGFIKGIKAQTSNMNVINSQLFNAADVISDALAILEFVLKKGNCTLTTELNNSIRLYGDPNSLVQVVTNMVMNSIDACKQNGGEISIALINAGDGFAKLTIKDTGCGIPEEILSRIFDPMFTTKPFGESTGLGLSIVHDLVNHFKGNISVESQEGLTSFVIILPVSQGEN